MADSSKLERTNKELEPIIKKFRIGKKLKESPKIERQEKGVEMINEARHEFNYLIKTTD